jgi:hypothetical protein
MKKYILPFLGVIIFITVYVFIFIAAYRLTDSWKMSLSLLGVLTLYIIWVIGIESGGFIKSSKKNIEEKFNSIKREHIKKTENNPTIR